MGKLRQWFCLAFYGFSLYPCFAQLAFENSNHLERVKDLPQGGGSYIRCLPNGGVITASPDMGYVLTNDWRITLTPPALRFPIAIQPDNKIVCLGNTNHCIIRINQDGSVDSNFNSPAVSRNDLYIGVDPRVTDIAVQTDGKIVVGCVTLFNQPPSQFRGFNTGLFRLNPDGTDDSTFQPTRDDDGVRVVRPLVDGKILVMSVLLYKLSPDGTLDSAFANNQSGADQFVVQPDGKIVIAGRFAKAGGGIRRPGLARLLPDGSLDFGFNPSVGPGISPIIFLGLQSDGAIVTADSQKIMRWTSDGQLDKTLNITTSGTFNALDMDNSDRIYIAEGAIAMYSGRERVIAPPADVPVNLQTSSLIDSGWTTVKTIPANVPTDYFDFTFPTTNNIFYRISPVLQ